MKNNLLKSVAAAATASALLFSTVTSFAATATTVTTYKDGNTVGVTSQITGATPSKMITYLASTATSVSNASQIKYIGQQTVPSSGSVTFSYEISGTDFAENTPIATIKYGSDDSSIATALNGDAAKEIQYGPLSITKNNCVITIGETNPEDLDGTTVNIGNGDEIIVNFQADENYQVKEVYLDGESKQDAVTAGKIRVKYTGKSINLAIICGAILQAQTNVVKVRDFIESDFAAGESSANSIGIVCSGVRSNETANVTFGVYAVDANGKAYKYDDNAADANGFFPAQVDSDGFYAVQFVKADSGKDLPAGLYPAYKDSEGKISWRDVGGAPQSLNN